MIEIIDREKWKRLDRWCDDFGLLERLWDVDSLAKANQKNGRIDGLQ